MQYKITIEWESEGTQQKFIEIDTVEPISAFQLDNLLNSVHDSIAIYNAVNPQTK